MRDLSLNERFYGTHTHPYTRTYHIKSLKEWMRSIRSLRTLWMVFVILNRFHQMAPHSSNAVYHAKRLKSLLLFAFMLNARCANDFGCRRTNNVNGPNMRIEYHSNACTFSRCLFVFV